VAYSLYSLDAQSYVYKGSSYSLNNLWSDTGRIFGSEHSKWQYGVDYAFKYGAQLVTDFSQAGTYSGIQVVVMKDGFTAASSGNTTGTLKIQPAPITVTANKQAKVYGDADPALSWKIRSGALFGKDQLNGDLSRLAGENVGTYAISQGTLSASGNYQLAFNPASLTITPRPLYIKGVRVFSKYYDGSTAATLDLRKLDIQGILPTDIGFIAVGINSTGMFSNPWTSNGKQVFSIAEIYGDKKTSDNYTLISPKLFANIVPRSSLVSKDNVMVGDYSAPRFVLAIVGTGINIPIK
jgi:hypothetical protein